MNSDLVNIYNQILTGNPIVPDNIRQIMIDKSMECINKQKIEQSDYDDIMLIIQISNALYNNGANITLPLDDPIYDALIVLCKVQGLQYPVGAPPIVFNVEPVAKQNYDLLETGDKGPKEVVRVIPNKDKMMYFHPLTRNYTLPIEEDFIVYHDNTLVKKKSRNVSSNYNMCGTLDKCKYTLKADALTDGVLDDRTVQIFERDFLGAHIEQGIINPGHIKLIASLKYDGVSVEEEVAGHKITFACTRGDTSNNEASDLTPILGGMEFPRAKGIVDESEVFGIKFEYIVTENNLKRIAQDFGKTYANPRNGVIGLLGGLDARMYRDYLTPIPLESSLNIDRLTELDFLNKYYTKNISMRHEVIEGDYTQVLFMVSQFVKNANELRDYMGFQYDGVVIEYADEYIRQRLGKRGAVPRYAIAIKFNPLRRVSTFTHYTYSVGQDGRVVPMAHFRPVEFFGAIHDKTTAHSLKRFLDLGLRCGDKVNLTLVNDVIVYITKADDRANDTNPNPLEEFPTKCPCCGSDLIITDSGNSAICPNFFCPEKVIGRLTNLFKKLNIKDFSSESIRALGVKWLRELYQLPKEVVIEKLGEANGIKFLQRLEDMRTTKFPDYRILGSIGFTSIASETWKIILKNVTLEELLLNTDKVLNNISAAKGIGTKTVETIRNEIELFRPDIEFIFNNFNIERTVVGEEDNKAQVRFSGLRDHGLANRFNEAGFDAREDAGVTGATAILVVPYIGFESGNVTKAFKAKEKNYKKSSGLTIEGGINYTNLQSFKNYYPFIMTPDEADQFLKVNYGK